LWHVGLPEHYLRRNPKLAVKGTKRMLANYKDATRVFPVSAAMERPNQPWAANHVTSACSPCPYRDDLFGPEFATSVFVSEPVHNAVHREVLTRHGAGFRSARAAGEENAEFLASTDPWFRPTTLKTGPDGALYIADFYRFITEHPDWISPEMQSRLDLRAGEDRGRIYRVVPLDSPRREIPAMSRLAGADLAHAMDSPSGWQRDTVQRRLAESARGESSPEAEGVLRGLISARFRPQVRAQALATLGMMGRLREGEVTAALADPHPAVRIEAARQSEAGAFLKEQTSGIYPALAALADDSNPAVRLQAAFSLGAWPPQLAEPLLARIAAREGEDGDEWIRAAVLSSLQPDSELFGKLNAPDQSAVALPVLALDPAKSARSAVLARYAGVGKLTGDAEAGRVHFQNLCAICHIMGGEGKEVGPDLGMVRGKPVDWLVAAILDPEANIEARYAAWQADLASGGAMIGIVAAETANSLTFRLPGGIERAVLRDDIKELKPAGISLMPAGFEAALDPQAMADLIAWLNK
ncbi:MAG: c-type cytochrome, partial [Akkermansiaceae bacterium]|nr:c-type cytochrome [Akkermansiaceae bacterium]